VLTSDFDYDLPPGQIAQDPPPVRGQSRMLIVDRGNGAWRDGWFQDLPSLLRPGDVLALNDSRVMPARLLGHRISGGGRVEALLVEQTGELEWRVLARPGRKLLVGERIEFPAPHGEESLAAVVTQCGEGGERLLRFEPVEDFFAALDRIGSVPLPPYIRRRSGEMDRERYQTVYARQRGSVAAPTAGLHFTPETLQRIRDRGVRVCFVTLHVGLGTFQPVRAEEVADIRLHPERYSLPEETVAEVRLALAEGRRVIAAGTTTVRTLEHCARVGRLEPHSGETRLFLSPPSRFQVVSGLLTNFHLPRSTLLMLVAAFAGRERMLAAYRHAVAAGYRFFSYGDCMFIA
jgi:S-adenosylmethionine:tRNA ribosyltransferase-isomerase